MNTAYFRTFLLSLVIGLLSLSSQTIFTMESSTTALCISHNEIVATLQKHGLDLEREWNRLDPDEIENPNSTVTNPLALKILNFFKEIPEALRLKQHNATYRPGVKAVFFEGEEGKLKHYASIAIEPLLKDFLRNKLNITFLTGCSHEILNRIFENYDARCLDSTRPCTIECLNKIECEARNMFHVVSLENVRPTAKNLWYGLALVTSYHFTQESLRQRNHSSIRDNTLCDIPMLVIRITQRQDSGIPINPSTTVKNMSNKTAQPTLPGLKSTPGLKSKFYPLSHSHVSEFKSNRDQKSLFETSFSFQSPSSWWKKGILLGGALVLIYYSMKSFSASFQDIQQVLNTEKSIPQKPEATEISAQSAPIATDILPTYCSTVQPSPITPSYSFIPTTMADNNWRSQDNNELVRRKILLDDLNEWRAPWIGMSHEKQSSMGRIAIVTLSTPQRDRNFVNITQSRLEQYAQKWGYSYLQYNESLAPYRPEEWSKIVAVAHHLPSYEWILWADDDAYITNPSISLEEIIDVYGNDRDLIVGMDPAYQTTFLAGRRDNKIAITFNNGIFLIKNSKWAHNYLLEVWHMGRFWDYRTRGESLLEQQTMSNLIDASTENQLHTRLVNPKVLQSFITCSEIEKTRAPIFRWRPGDFIAHVGPNEIRVPVMKFLDEHKDNPVDISMDCCPPSLKKG